MCARCGRPFASQVTIESAATPLCHFCRKDLYHFDFARSYCVYTAEMARAIILLKYDGVTPLGHWFARRLLEVVEAHRERYTADVVVPVPAHAARLRERGYNHAELIARPLARCLNLPFRSYLLVRTQPRPDKLRLTVRERWRTVRSAYATRQGTRVDKLRVLLIDDVFTTGATLDACSRALRGAGASEVAALTVARAVPRGEVAGADRLAEGARPMSSGGQESSTSSGGRTASPPRKTESRQQIPPPVHRKPAVMQEPVLVLNATFEPINVTAVRRAMMLLLKGVAQAEEINHHEVHSTSRAMKVPSVIRLLAYRHIPQQTRALSRKNILLRDRNTCQFCGRIFPASELTLDHVVPRSRGGRSSWENLVACCYTLQQSQG